MGSFTWGVFAGVGAFFISLLLGILFDVRASVLFLRSFIFGAVFFGLGFGVKFAINSFFPELIAIGNKEESREEYDLETRTQSVVIDKSGEYAVPEMYKIPGVNQELGNIEDLVSGHFSSQQETSVNAEEEGIDSGAEEGYNYDRENFVSQDTSVFEKLAEAPPVGEMSFEEPEQKPSFTPSFGEDLGGLPDLDAMAMAFSSTIGGPAPAPSSGASSSIVDSFFPDVGPALQEAAPAETERSPYVGNKPQPLEGDFDPKELAQGIRTVLSKDN